MISVGLELRDEVVEESSEGSAAVAEGEAGDGVDLGHGEGLFGDVEEWIVAEAGGSPRGDEDGSFYCAVGGLQDFAVAGCGEDAAVAGGTESVREAVEFAEEAEVVALVEGGG